ncbi:nucleoside hydrolase [Lactobacillus sp. DCY120]|uniref:Nucleoside hydrolase n=1 Tax=Bombilactobacillus apium TaxID=2675299 RepID=A0A850R6S5_9LACO|nr:nucleoside hydrolase [Bombilactobacillus apium]NVY96527.1 nucleoside hydrolase [Bombilactobacillus apium]
MTTKIVFDCDPGSDDALAILETFAHPKEVEVLGMTTVGGNQVLTNVTRNLQHLLWFLHQQTPMAAGQAVPLIKNLENASEFHGENGLAGPTFPSAADQYPVQKQGGIVFLHEIISQSDVPITIVATAPLTNISLLLKVFPEDKAKIARIIIMGGTLTAGNVTDAAEFNFYVDPDAAQIVLSSGIEIILCGLDVTHHTALTAPEIDSLHDRGPASELAYKILVPYFAAEKKHGFTMAPIHDLATITYLLHPEYFQGEKHALAVATTWDEQRGAVQIIEQEPANILVLKQVDRAAAAQFLLDSLALLDARLS